MIFDTKILADLLNEVHTAKEVIEWMIDNGIYETKSFGGKNTAKMSHSEKQEFIATLAENFACGGGTKETNYKRAYLDKIQGEIK